MRERCNQLITEMIDSQNKNRLKFKDKEKVNHFSYIVNL